MTFAVASIAGQVVADGAGTAVASGCVHTGVQAQTARLAHVEELALVNVCTDRNTNTVTAGSFPPCSTHLVQLQR